MVEGENIPHYVKREGNYPGGEMSGDISMGKYQVHRRGSVVVAGHLPGLGCSAPADHPPCDE